MQLKGAEKNYPVHEKELLAVICALKKWRSDLISSEFFVYTDHHTLENFNTNVTYLDASSAGRNFCHNITLPSSTSLARTTPLPMPSPA
jgi:hypothetical protein